MQTNSNKLDQIVKPLKTIDLSGATPGQEEPQDEQTNNTPSNNTNQNGAGGNNNVNNQGYTPSNGAANGAPNGNPPGFPFYNKFPQGQGHGGAPMIHHPPFQYPQYHPHPPGMPPFIRGNLFMPF